MFGPGSYGDDPRYIRCMTRKITDEMDKVGGKPLLLFSAHGLPQSFVKKGDTYQKEMYVTMHKIKEILDLQKRSCTALLAFQVHTKWIENSHLCLIPYPFPHNSRDSALQSGWSRTLLTCASVSRTTCSTMRLVYWSFQLRSLRTISKPNLKWYGKVLTLAIDFTTAYPNALITLIAPIAGGRVHARNSRAWRRCAPDWRPERGPRLGWGELKHYANNGCYESLGGGCAFVFCCTLSIILLWYRHLRISW